MALLEVRPGVTLLDAFRTAGGGFGDDCPQLQIGRSPPLSSDKSRTHFPILREVTGVPYEDMLFFDDCNWTDHVAAVGRECGVVGQRTPHGLTEAEWEQGLENYRAARS